MDMTFSEDTPIALFILLPLYIAALLRCHVFKNPCLEKSTEIKIKSIQDLRNQIQRCRHLTVYRKVFRYNHHVFIGNVDQLGCDIYHFKGAWEPCLTYHPPAQITKERLVYSSYADNKKIKEIFDFENGERVVIVNRNDYPQSIDAEENCIKRAESRVGGRNYSIPHNNCESFVNWVFSGDNTSQEYKNATIFKKTIANIIDVIVSSGPFILFGIVSRLWNIFKGRKEHSEYPDTENLKTCCVKNPPEKSYTIKDAFIVSILWLGCLYIMRVLLLSPFTKYFIYTFETMHVLKLISEKLSKNHKAKPSKKKNLKKEPAMQRSCCNILKNKQNTKHDSLTMLSRSVNSDEQYQEKNTNLNEQAERLSEESRSTCLASTATFIEKCYNVRSNVSEYFQTTNIQMQNHVCRDDKHIYFDVDRERACSSGFAIDTFDLEEIPLNVTGNCFSTYLSWLHEDGFDKQNLYQIDDRETQITIQSVAALEFVVKSLRNHNDIHMTNDQVMKRIARDSISAIASSHGCVYGTKVMETMFPDSAIASSIGCAAFGMFGTAFGAGAGTFLLN